MKNSILSGGQTGTITYGTCCGMTAIGGRKSNEDSIGILTLEDAMLLVVADGLGGHRDGEVASAMAVRILCEEIKGSYRPGMPDEDRKKLLSDAFKAAHIQLRSEAILRQNNLDTTLVAVLLSKSSAVVANTGDSRAYLFSREADGGYSVNFETKDHSAVRELVDSGVISPEEGKGHPMAGVLTHTLRGAFEVDVSVQVRDRDVVMVMSDGVWGVIGEKTIYEVLERGGSAKEVCETIMAEAERMATDNISLIVGLERDHP